MPTTEVGIIDLFKTWLPFLVDPGKVTAFKWPATVVTALIAAGDAFVLARDEYVTNKTSDNRVAKNTAKRVLVALMRDFAARYIRLNENMTDAEKAAMGVMPRDTTKTPIPAPATVPLVVKVTPLSGQQVRFHFKDEPSIKSQAVPYGYEGAILHYCWGDDKVEDKALMTTNVMMTASPFTLEDLPPEAEKSYLSFCLQWQTGTGLVGHKGAVGFTVVT
jgi:hypothetical protein